MKDKRKSDEILTDIGDDIINFFNYLENIFKDNKKEKEWKINHTK